MRVNEETVLVGQRVVLVPYREEHVARYHEWMQDAATREATASEPLSLDEEYAMQKSWHLDDDKLTFIVLARSLETCGSTPTSIEEVLASSSMAGDVNLFLVPDEDEDDEEGDGTDREGAAEARMSKLAAEVEVMIAESTQRRKGLALEALSLLLHYANAGSLPAPFPLPPTSFLAKIGLDNGGSRALFKRLGFEEKKISEVWKEVEVRWTGRNATPPLCTLRWPLRSEA